MLTRLEVDGFKNLINFDCYFGPFTCIVGPNAVGKSNIFDAIEFVSLLADHSIQDATQLLRGTGAQISDPRSLFWNNASSSDPTMRFGVEMIVPSCVEDDFGRESKPTTTFLRYDLVLKYEAPDAGSPQTGRIRLARESLMHIRTGDAYKHLPWPHKKSLFRDAVVLGRRAGTAYISTTADDSGAEVINIHADGGSRGKPRPALAARSPRTVISTATTSDDPTILAVRREMEQWRILGLEPSAMRSPDSVMDPPQVTQTGARLAASLNRMVAREGEEVLDGLAADAAALTDVRGIRVDYDEKRDTLTLEARLGSGPWLPAKSLSDGTLRFLALCIMRRDDRGGGLLCMEEPENGIHPAKIAPMVDLVRSMAVDPFEAPGADNPFRQMIVNSHSPTFVAFQEPDDLLCALPSKVAASGGVMTSMSLMSLPRTWRSSLECVSTISRSGIADYLRGPTDALISPEDVW